MKESVVNGTLKVIKLKDGRKAVLLPDPLPKVLSLLGDEWEKFSNFLQWVPTTTWQKRDGNKGKLPSDAVLYNGQMGVVEPFWSAGREEGWCSSAGGR